MTMTFKEALIAHLQGQKVEVRAAQMDVPWQEFMTYHGQCYLAQINDPAFGGACEYRLAPRTILVNGVEVPAPGKDAPADGETYFIPDLYSESMCYEYKYRGESEMHKLFLERGLIYLDKESAIARAKAMLITQEVK